MHVLENSNLPLFHIHSAFSWHLRIVYHIRHQYEDDVDFIADI